MAERSRLLVVATIALAGTLAGSVAVAQQVYDLSSAAALLEGSGALGTVTGVEGATAEEAGTGPCANEDFPDGYAHASVYRVAPNVRALLDLDVRDDRDESLSVCRVSLYRGVGSFTDPFDAAQRAPHLVREDTRCASGDECGLDAWLDGGSVYYVVLWAEPPDLPEPGPDSPPPPSYEGPTEALFSYGARVRRPLEIALTVTGHRIRDRCYGYHEVVYRRRFSVRADTSPNVAGTVRFYWYRKTAGGTWALSRAYDRTLRDGDATLTLSGGSTGKRRVKARFGGSATVLPFTSGLRYVRYVTPKWTRYADGGKKLTVRYYRQKYRLSCEAATLRMAHNYFHPSRIDDDRQVYRITGVDKRRPAVHRGCNPNRAFCGAINGYMMSTGYGVHYRPIARAATYYDPCRPAVALAGDSYRFSTIARHVNNGYPVIVWGAHRGASGIYKHTWTAWDGTRVRAWSVEHTWTVVGFRGKPSYPTHFIIHNPSGSDYKKVSRAAFYDFVKYFKTGVVVRG